jgi:hypothetical protein
MPMRVRITLALVAPLGLPLAVFAVLDRVGLDITGVMIILIALGLLVTFLLVLAQGILRFTLGIKLRSPACHTRPPPQFSFLISRGRMKP